MTMQLVTASHLPHPFSIMLDTRLLPDQQCPMKQLNHAPDSKMGLFSMNCTHD
jgi:hypothetical protein